VDIKVEDTGRGIEKEDFTAIFEEFKQIDGGINREVGGTGTA
jgi:signal transduction histidine kinase